ncbi:MAG TPA: hypothetical protein VN541_10575, partial [Tepidisphaeraceae bacterium]|nr:hypothetical protein [Tepidisphaeraceae bacterium]
MLATLGITLARLLYIHGGPPGLSWRTQFLILGIAALVGLGGMLAGKNERIPRLVAAVRYPSLRARCWTAAGVWAVAVVYLTLTAFAQHRDLFPRIHDELSYTIQARMLSHGRLWMPRHELADFFETFHFLTRPVYGSIYFPG